MKKKRKKRVKVKITDHKKFLVLFILLAVLLLIIIILFKNQIGDYIKIAGKNILKTDDCSDWNECYFTYNLDNSENVILDGEQKRTCLDNGVEKTETRKCFPNKSITTKRAGSYIEVYDSQGNFISKLELDKVDEYEKLNIEIFK